MTKAFEIPKKLIWEAFKCVKANGGAAGVDLLRGRAAGPRAGGIESRTRSGQARVTPG